MGHFDTTFSSCLTILLGFTNPSDLASCQGRTIPCCLACVLCQLEMQRPCVTSSLVRLRNPWLPLFHVRALENLLFHHPGPELALSKVLQGQLQKEEKARWLSWAMQYLKGARQHLRRPLELCCYWKAESCRKAWKTALDFGHVFPHGGPLSTNVDA